ncbi:MAG TPA: hypothetical protein VFB15_06800 [Candidatus Binataceae bacterium]|nr:hypothetical protein [Candidatus Binataceae bacterium]
MRRPKPNARVQQRCVGCGMLYAVANMMASSVGLCERCNGKSPFSWRTVYDRERRIGRIPANLAGES